MRHGHTLLIGALVVVALAVALTVIGAAGQDSVAANGTIYYVDADAIGVPDGNSWETAFTTLQPALDAAGTGDQIWVAEGTYTPTAEHGGSGDRYKSFQMVNGVAIYGGFDPSVGHTEWEDRDWVAHLTILSGDLNGDDGPDFANNDENSYHVFYHPSGTNLDSTAVLDGFTIAGGNANGADVHERGGGMHNNSFSSPTLRNCTFAGNSAGSWGGGMYNNYFSSPALSDCTFAGNESIWVGGGMVNNQGSSPMLTGCTFSDNSAGAVGGGVVNDDGSSPTLANCTFSGNSASQNGGGMYNSTSSSPTLTGCTFSGNSAGGMAGGMYNTDGSSPTLTDVTFSGNSAYAIGGACTGGGMVNHKGSSPTLTDCTFYGNSVPDRGGGMCNDGSSPMLTGVIFSANSAGGEGGGMYNINGSSPTLTNCTFEGNHSDTHGGGMANWSSSPTLANCTFAGNSAGGIGGGMTNGGDSSPILTNCTFWGNSAEAGGAMSNWYSLPPTLTNCILWGNTPDQIGNDETTPVVTHSDVQGGYPGDGNIDTYPFFVDPASGDFHLGACSRCIDAGDNAAPDLPDYDFEGDDRIVDGDDDGTATVDMGVDEVAVAGTCLHVYLPLVLRGY